MQVEELLYMLQQLNNPPDDVVPDVTLWRKNKIAEWNQELAPHGLEINEGSDWRGNGEGWFYVGMNGEA